MGLCASACACCCGKAAKCCCWAGKSEVGSKVFYLIIMFIVIVLGVVVRVSGGDMFSGMYSFESGCPTEPQAAVDRCVGMQSVYRVSFALFVFFIVMAIFTRAARGFHTGFWICKLPLLLLLLIGAFFIPNEVFDVYQEVARIGSILFILLQVLILIDFAFDLHNCMLGKAAAYDAQLEADGYEANLCGNCWKVGYVLVCTVIILFGFGGAAAMYVVLPTCGLNTFFISQAIVVGLVVLIISVTEKIGKGLLPPAILLAHSVFLTWSAIRSNPDVECNDAATDDSFQGVAIGVVVAACSLTWTSFRMGASAYNVFRCDGDAPSADDGEDADEAEARRQERLEAALTEREEKKAEAEDEDSDKPKVRRAFKGDDDEEVPDDQVHWPFHVVMALGGLYLAMLLTNWGSVTTTDLTAATDLSETSMWVKMASQWLSIIIYIWTLVAPLCCKGRDFTDPHNSFARS